MIELYKVSAETADGKALVTELFEARSDAAAFFKELTEEGSPLASAGVGAVVVASEELRNGAWTVAARRLVVP